MNLNFLGLHATKGRLRKAAGKIGPAPENRSSGTEDAANCTDGARVDVIGGGALVLDRIVARFGFGEVLVSEHDILDGMAWSLAAGWRG